MNKKDDKNSKTSLDTDNDTPKKLLRLPTKNTLYGQTLTYDINLSNKNYKGNVKYGNNEVKTSKYTPWLFLPFNLFYQFTKIANVYFVLLTILQIIPMISLTKGVPTILLPLLFVVIVSVIKDFLEDRKRWIKDIQENYSITKKLENGDFVDCKYKDLHVGEIIKIECDQFIPADIILIETSDNVKNIAFIETKNLDGETNLNKKIVNPKFIDEIKKQGFTSGLQFFKTNIITLSYEGSNPILYKFEGNMKINENLFALNNDNLILRGCILRNTPYVIGIVCYNGHHSKIMKNAVKAKEKRSLLEHKMYTYVVFVFIFLIFLCLLCATFYTLWKKNNQDFHQYLYLLKESTTNAFFIRFFNWILVFSNFVPISLVVTMETVKFLQAYIFNKSKKMVDYLGINCTANSSGLNEELGQIEFVFTDKTGTLTCNKMVFKHLIVGDKDYPRKNYHEDEILKTPDFLNEVEDFVDFEDNYFFNQIQQDKKIETTLSLLSLCHMVQIYNNKYTASSPDELALVTFAKKCGFEFMDLNENQEMIIKEYNQEKKYQLKFVLEFTSFRSRMSVIIKNELNEYFLLTKGSDEKLFSISKKNMAFGDINKLKKKIDNFAKTGLRTLVLAQKKLTEEEFENFKKKYEKASNEIGNRERAISEVEDEIETDLEIIGATAIEDKLQDQVPEVIKFMREANIKVWILTGDKIETAINIGFSSNLLSKEMFIFKITDEKREDINETIKQYLETIRQDKKNQIHGKYAVVIPGKVLTILLHCPKVTKKFVRLILNCESVLCCRVSPKQKREVVDLVNKELPIARTLAIGDGANDVNMIVGANVGVGIRGVEGQQAARAADYTIGEFRFLKELLFKYGREYYRKNSVLILYNFWKNLILVVPQFWYAVVYNNFSGATLYEANLYQYVNVFYTSLPIIIYCLFDKEIYSESLLKNPQFYKEGQKNSHFNFHIFLVWFFFGITQALIIALVVSFADFAPQKNGRYFGFWGYGIIVFIMTQIICNLKIIVMSNSVNFWIYFFILMGFIFFIISFIVVNLISSNELFGLLKVVFASPIFYITTILVVVQVSFFDFLFTITQKILFFKYINISLHNYFALNMKKNKTIHTLSHIAEKDHNKLDKTELVTSFDKEVTDKEMKYEPTDFFSKKNNISDIYFKKVSQPNL